MTRTTNSKNNVNPALAIPRSAIFIWRLQEWILIVAGVLLLAVVGLAHIEAALVSRSMMEQFHGEASPVDRSALRLPEDHGQQGDFGSARTQQLAGFVGGARETLTPLAIVRIPRLHLAAPLLEGTDALTLNHALGRIPGTARLGERGNIGIAGHRDGLLRGLKDIRIGDVIQLDGRGRTDTYVVEQVRIVDPKQVDVLKPRPLPSLTLVTCYPFYFLGSAPKRFVVTASLKH
jgi:sortase A